MSTYKPDRNTDHWFAQAESLNPLRFQLNVGEMHESAQEGSGPDGPLPADGMDQVSYFVSVRSPENMFPDPVPNCVVWCVPPGLSLNQDFDTFVSAFYYAPAPDAWSFVAGDPDPFS